MWLQAVPIYSYFSDKLFQEALVMKLMMDKKCNKHIALLLDQGRLNVDGKKAPTQFIVMSLLGPSISDLRKMCRRKLTSPSTTAMLGIQMIEAVADLHKCGFIHRDIKYK